MMKILILSLALFLGACAAGSAAKPSEASKPDMSGPVKDEASTDAVIGFDQKDGRLGCVVDLGRGGCGNLTGQRRGEQRLQKETSRSQGEGTGSTAH